MIFGALYSEDPENSDDFLDVWKDVAADSWESALRIALEHAPEGRKLAKLSLLVEQE